ncbi:MAG: hypothetical protein K1000chlam4_00477 [Chlamydiae bacterium]|nr:hypothetical protein [Chlamydiota bacterium]
MPEIDFNAALGNVEFFNQSKDGKVVGNFAKLKRSEDGSILPDRSRNNVARFAATFFSLGLYQKYRTQNKARSLSVQDALDLSVQKLIATPTDDLTPAQCVTRETALKTYNAILFTRHGNFFSRCLGNFYYWVLGVQNVNLKRQDIAFSPRTEGLVRAVHDAARSSATARPAGPARPALASSAPPLALPGSSDLTHSREREGPAAPLTPLQQKFLDLMVCSLVAQETYISRSVGCATTTEFDAHKKRVERAQNEAVSENIDAFITRWQGVDEALVDTAAQAGYVNGSRANNTINAYYDHLKARPEEAAQMRRIAEERMTELMTEVSSEVMLELFGDIAAMRFPRTSLEIIRKASMISGESEVEEVYKPTITSLMFSIFSDRIQTKLFQKYPEELKGEHRVLIEYQSVMFGLKMFGVMEIVLGILKKTGIINNLRAQLGLSEGSAEDVALRAAFERYVSTIKAEQTVNRTLMQQLGKGELHDITAEDYLDCMRPIMNKLSSFNPTPPSSASSPSSLFGLIREIRSFKSQFEEANDLDINSLGIIMSKPPPEVQQTAKNFVRQLVQDAIQYLKNWEQILRNAEPQIRSLIQNPEERTDPLKLEKGTPALAIE